MRLSGAFGSEPPRAAATPTAKAARLVPGHVVSLRRTVAALLATLVLFATVAVGVVISPAKPAGATVFQSGQIFASVGNSTVNVYDPSSGDLVSSLTDATSQDFTVGSAFDSSGDFYVADDLSGEISEYSPTGAYTGVFASGLANPISLVFDNQGNLYAGQQQTPYIAEFNSSGQNVANFGPVTTQETGDDWIDLASDECTFYYTTEGNEIFRYNKCTNTQEPVFNQQPLTGANAFQVKILQDGDVLVADSQAVDLLDPNGNLIQTYNCDPTVLPDCGGQFFAIALDPDGTSFWTADAFSGNIYRIDIATGQLLQTIQTGSAYLYGLSIENELNAATSPTVEPAAPTSLAIQPVSGNFSTPTPVSAVLTNSSTGAPIPGEQVTITLNGTETCTATTDDTGTATCIITPSEPSESYTLTASFPGDSTSSSPFGSDSTSTTFTVTPDTSTVAYTGPTTATNGQPVTLTGTLTTDTPTAGTPLPTKVVTIKIGSGSTTQTCNGTSDANGNVSCTIPSVDQTTSDVPITTSFGGDAYDSPVSTTTSAMVTEPTTLMVNSATGDYSDATQVSGVLTDSVTNAPIPNEPVTLTLNGTETCTATTDSAGMATCTITPGEPAATYSLTGTFGGDTTLPLQLMPATGSANFVVTLEETALTYTGATVAQNGQPLTVSGVLTTDNPVPGSGLGGRMVTFTLGSGSAAQTCGGVTSATGTVSCTIAVTGQPPGPIPVTDSFGGDAYYRVASAASTVNLPEGTELTITPVSGTFDASTPVSGTLIDTYTNQPVPNEPVTLTVNGTQSCTAATNAGGVATCSIAPNEPAGAYSLTGSFPGDTTTTPQLSPGGSSSTITVTQAPTTFTYTGTTSVTNGQAATLSGVLTSNEPATGTDVSGKTLTFTLGTGGSLQSCTAVTNASGAASCTIADVNQGTGTTGVSAGFGGDIFYQPSTAASTVTVHTPTTLRVNAGTSDYADAGAVSGVLTNAVTGAAIAGESVTLTLNGTQSCTATTSASGVATCSITPNEPAATYTLTGSFAGDASVSPQLLSSTGSNNYVVTLEETSIANTGPAVAVSGMPFTLSANLTTDGSPLGGRAVLMTLGSSSTAQSCTGTTNASGAASCTIAEVNQTAGTVPITVVFGGDAYYRPASAAGNETTAAAPSSGGFVVGDVTAGAPTLGTDVNFWGSQFWKNNAFSGVVNAPASMKGYIDNAPGFACGVNWTSDPGNSSDPPSTIPVNMLVVVSSTIQQSGSTEYGNIKHLVVVSVTPGYGPSPGHDGWGHIIATIC